jgi:putative flippase GtrA
LKPEILKSQLLRRQVPYFIAVGFAAGLTHMSVVALLVELFGWQPLVSNVAAFCVAFCVSSTGHSRLTFPQPPRQRLDACRRYAVLAITSFTLNQTIYAYALDLFGADLYLPILAVVVLAVAVFTFTMSRLWAFAQREKPA